MFKKDNFGFGFSLAVITTAAVFGLLYLVNNIILLSIFNRLIFRESFLMILSMGVNIFSLNYYLNRNANKTARGMLTFVFLCAAYIIYTYFAVDLGLKKAPPSQL